MTNSRSSAEPPADIPVPGIVMPPKVSAKPRRTGSRRVSLPAGAPVKNAAAASALLIFGADGKPITQVPDDAAGGGADSAPDTDTAPGVSAEATAPHDFEGRAAAEPETLDADTAHEPEAKSENVEGPEPDAHEPIGSPVPATEPEPETEAPDADTAPEPEAESEDGSEAEPDAHDPAASLVPATEPEPGTEAPDADTAPDPAAGAVFEAVESVSVQTPEPGPDSPAAVPGPTDEIDVSAEPSAPEPVIEAAHLSRRERRLAEQKMPDGVVPARSAAAPAAPEPEAPAPEAAAAPRQAALRGKPPKQRKKLWSYLRAFLLFTCIAAVVIGMGTVVTGEGAPEDGPSATETTRQQVWSESKALLATVQTLNDAAASTASRSVLNATSAALEVHIAALADGLPTPSAEARATASPTPAATAQGFATALSANANALLAAAVNAEGSMGRVFASAGTSQLLQATAFSLANGLPAPTSPFLPPVANHEPPAPVCNTLLKPQPGVSSDAALIAAADAEQKAVFAYQISTTRLAEPNFSKSKALLATHQDRLVLLNRELALRCLPQAAPVPGFVLDPAFGTAPKTALADLEGQLTVLYADMAALSKPQQGVPTESGPTETMESVYAANASVLRDLSVKWLLASAINQQFWGGAPGPLPGIGQGAPSATAAAPARSAP